jgi:hypothetical protein
MIFDKAVHRLALVEAVAEHVAIGFRRLREAIAIRLREVVEVEGAERMRTNTRRRWYWSFREYAT